MNVYTLAVELSEVEPAVWRRLEVPGNLTLRGFHDALQVAFGWADYHLYHFEVDGQKYGYVQPDLEQPDTIDDRDHTVEEVLPPDAEPFEYLYDYGDEWVHEITVESVEQADGDARPRCLDGENAAPPEDVGGPWGYEQFLEAFHDPEHPEHERWYQWIGGEWDESEFDVDLHDRVLDDIRWQTRKS